jgi:hypothetical protein
MTTPAILSEKPGGFYRWGGTFVPITICITRQQLKRLRHLLYRGNKQKTIQETD